MKKGTFKDISGKKYGRLTPLEMVGQNEQHRALWFCECECGGNIVATTSDITRGHTRSCGCLRKETARKRMTKHGMRYTRLYCIWLGMKKRITNPNSQFYHCYGGRGISMCDEWMNDFMPFYKWAMENGYKDNLSIDRIDNDGNYEPNNCRWATEKEQAMNRRTGRR